MIKKSLVFLVIVLVLVGMPSTVRAAFVPASRAARESRDFKIRKEKKSRKDFFDYAEDAIAVAIISGENNTVIVPDDSQLKYMSELSVRLKALGYTVKVVNRIDFSRLEVSW